jgi:membrane protein implicated in regulation of membrane protease activity
MRYAKFFVALLGAVGAGLAAAIPLLSDGTMSTQEVLMVVLAAVTAIGVYAVPNKRGPDETVRYLRERQTQRSHTRRSHGVDPASAKEDR